MTTFEHLYSNLFSYPLYIGVCLLLMLLYSVIYLLLAVYVERINPGEFGIAQPLHYLFKKSYWKPRSTSSIHPVRNTQARSDDPWIELSDNTDSDHHPLVVISHLSKVSTLALHRSTCIRMTLTCVLTRNSGSSMPCPICR
jgi:hypothetical protein